MFSPLGWKNNTNFIFELQRKTGSTIVVSFTPENKLLGVPSLGTE